MAADRTEEGCEGRCRIPAVDVTRHRDGGYVLRCELPGVSREQLKVLMKDNELTIKAPRSWSEEGLALLREIPREGFERRFMLGRGLDGENISGSFSQGILTLVIPKGKSGRRAIPIAKSN
jgi:HSP20 family protein